MKASFTIAAVFVLLALLSSCASYDTTSTNAPITYTGGAQTYSHPILSDTSLIAVGDSVVLSVWGYSEFATRAIVKATGAMSAPLLGEVPAAGLTKIEFSKELRDRLAEYIQGEIKLSLDVSHASPRITVLGPVFHQGSFTATADLPLLEVFSNAGGWTVDADLRYIKIARQATIEGGRRFIEIDLNAFLESGNVRALPLVHPGDVVIVPIKENFIRDVGDFFRDAFLVFGVFGIFK